MLHLNHQGGNEAAETKEKYMANQKVKIVDEQNEVTCVTEISGARRGSNLYIDRANLGQPGDIISVPEFWVEDFEGDAAKKYEGAEKDDEPICPNCSRLAALCNCGHYK